MRKYLAVGILMLGLCLVLPFAGHAADVPTNIALSSTEETITVRWEGDTDADSYNIYWGTASNNLNQNASVEDPETEYTITGLITGTEYFIAVSAVDNAVESNRSAIESITTDADTEPPAAPTGFDITAVSAIQETSARFEWDGNTESDLENYTIFFGTISGDYSGEINAGAQSSAKTVTGLSASTRYFFTIAAVDTSGNVSEKPDELIVDTLPDNLGPNPPAAIDGALAGSNALQVTIDSGNERMVDFAGNTIYYGTESGVYDYSRDIGEAGEFTFQTLPEDKSTWFFSASAYDRSGNESAITDEITVEVEEVSLFLDNAEDFEGGCFVHAMDNKSSSLGAAAGFGAFLLLAGLALRKPRVLRLFLILLLAVSFAGPARAENWEKAGVNTAGLTLGYFVAQDSQYDDFYGDNSFPVSLFYDRLLNQWLSIEIEAGYWKDSGRLRTLSGSSTAIPSEIEMVPAALSLKLNFPVADYITGYIGLGPDFWYVKEEPANSSGKADVKEWVGGYHGKIGVMLYNTDERYEGTGALLETGYAVMDRFGENETDIGGWVTELGFFYQF